MKEENGKFDARAVCLVFFVIYIYIYLLAFGLLVSKGRNFC